jgi:hypothetical protein
VKRWIACRLAFRGWHREPLMQPGASPSCSSSTRRRRSRPGIARARCAARGLRAVRRDLARDLHPGPANADAIDAASTKTNASNANRAGSAPHRADLELPKGTFVLHDGDPFIVLRSSMRQWTNAGYTERCRVPMGAVPP